MNKKLVAISGAIVILLFVSGWALIRLTSLGQAEGLLALILQLFLLLLGFPLRLYAILFLRHGAGSWSLPVLVCMLLLTGLFWGLIIERIVFLFRKRHAAPAAPSA